MDPVELNQNWWLLTPEFILVGWAALLISVDLFLAPRDKEPLGYLAAMGALLSLIVSLTWIDERRDFANIIEIDNYTTMFRVFFAGIAVFACVASARYAKDRLMHVGEYYAFILLAVVGANGMAAANELLTAYISLELLSFCLYVLVSFAKFDLRSNEGGLKYMLLGAFSSAIFLYGVGFVYGATGSTDYRAIGDVLGGDIDDVAPVFYMGLALMIAGLGFKVSSVPFHMWTPDAYEGAPLPITAYVSALSKAAGFALFLKVFTQAFLPLVDDWRYVIAALSVLTMALGNFVALQQHNIKRLLAYSSIAQVGYMLMGIAALSPDSASALVLMLVGYVVSNLAAFTCIIVYYNWTGKEEIADYAGLAERAPFLAMCLSAALFSLAGMPLFAGFATKFMLFQSAADEDLLWLAAAAVFFSFVSLYYYLVVIRVMYLGKPEETTRFRIPWREYTAVALLTLGVLFVGLYPQPVFDAVEDGTQAMFEGAAVEETAARRE
jgi:NADH-quinone oxidoreductase subunit N